MVREADAAALAASSTSSTLVFGGIVVVVTGAVFGGPYLETRRRSASVGRALNPTAPTTPDAGYEELFEAEQPLAYRIAALMTGNADRATAIVEETFSRTLQQWTRLPAAARVSFVLSTDVKLCIGRSFVRSLGGPVGTAPAAETDDLMRAARTLAVLEPTRRAIVILSRAEGLKPDEVAQVVGANTDHVIAELDAALGQLGPVLGAVAA